MKIINMSQCNKINVPFFNPSQSNIGQSYKGFLFLEPYSPEACEVIELTTPEELLNLISSHYKHLSFIEALFLFDFITTENIQIDFSNFCQRIGWSGSHLNFEKFKFLVEVSREQFSKTQAFHDQHCTDTKIRTDLENNTILSFLKWCQDKKLNPQDFVTLNSIKNLNSNLSKFEKIFQQIVGLSLSKQSGLQTLELFIEILLLDKDLAIDFSIKGETQFLNHLRSIRYPIATQADQMQDQKVKQYTWPNGVQAKWARRGDKAGIEVKLFLSNTVETKKNIQLLEKVQNDFFN